MKTIFIIRLSLMVGNQKVRVALITPGKRGTTESDNKQDEDDNDESNEINS